jgi:hypothetical protein
LKKFGLSALGVFFNLTLTLKMKRAFICMVFLVLLCIAAVESQETVTIDTAIINSAEHFINRLPAGSTVVILNFESAHEKLAVYVIDELTMYLVNDGRLIVVDRLNLEAIRLEMDFQISGEVSDESAQAIGRMLGAQTIISGMVRPMGNVYRLTTRAIAVETGVIQGINNISITMDETLASLTGTEYTIVDATNRFSLAEKNVFAIGGSIGMGTSFNLGSSTSSTNYELIVTFYERHFQNPFGLSFFGTIGITMGLTEANWVDGGVLCKWRFMNDRLLWNAGFSLGYLYFGYFTPPNLGNRQFYYADRGLPSLGVHGGMSFRPTRILSLNLNSFFRFGLGSVETRIYENHITGPGKPGPTIWPNVFGLHLGIGLMFPY